MPVGKQAEVFWFFGFVLAGKKKAVKCYMNSYVLNSVDILIILVAFEVRMSYTDLTEI